MKALIVAFLIVFATSLTPAFAASPDNGSASGGAAIARIEVADEAGRFRTLATWPGKTALLNIWATWCERCREEMPTLDRT